MFIGWLKRPVLVAFPSLARWEEGYLYSGGVKLYWSAGEAI